ncbi:hypothetical protein COV15_01210 [Candidatus Woesearchaeota archaeon CG10_big_fil_rev_8_21_14_0_10_34_12]|nr:MAG: hypothetical protein COV15_01210 [Candidatus Woesearchaeota archaeon CG10_big_fil_rev_8_21_14_0_10_34_12]
MEKRLVSLVILLSITLLFVSMPVVSAQTYSGFSKFTDSIRLFFSSGDNKANLALDIREKEVNSAISNLEAGDTKNAEKNLNSASEKLKIVQILASPDISADVKENIDGVENKIRETKGDYELLDNYLSEEEKTKLSMDISEKVFSYCDELAMQDYALMQKDEKCKSYAWMENKIKQRLNEEQENSKGEIETQVQACMNNPKECNCDNIKLLSEKTKCEEYKSLAIKCEFQNDNSACEKIKMFNLQVSEREKYEKEIIEKYLPAECSEAGVRDGAECKRLILTLSQPKTECIENGEYVGEEKCREKLVNQRNVVKECVVDGKLVDPEQCRNIVKEGNKPTGKEWELMSGECKERGVYDPVACDEIVNLPRSCKDAGYYTKKECEAMILNQNLPKECVDAGALTPEACEKLKLPSDCQGAYSREECEKIKIEQKFPDECKIAGEFDPAKCAVIMIGDQSLVVTAGAEMEYLVRQGLTFEEIPSVCMNEKNFIRSMDCDAELAKKGIVLPPPSDTSNIPKECMINGVSVSPLECQNKLEKNIIIDTTPKECQNADVTNSEECGKFIEEKRIEEGIGINMPPECVGISIEECKKVMEEKGIKVEKIEQVQRVEKVEKVQKMCKEGEVCEEETGYEEVTLPRECIEMGVSDVKDCKIIAGRINEERIKNGEKITLDEDGKVEYMHPEQIEKIIEDSRKTAQEIKPNLEIAEGVKQEIKDLEINMNQIEERREREISGGNVGGNNVVQEQNEINNELSSGDSSGKNNEISGGSESSGSSEGNFVEGGGSESSEGDSAGGDSGITGAVIGSGNKESFLGRFFKRIFG